MLRVTSKTRESFRAAQLAQLKREVIAHARRKVVVKVPHDARVVSERLESAFERAHAFLSARETDHYDSYVYLTICFFFIDENVSDAAIHAWLENEFISPITRARTLYFLLKKAIKGEI
jgi:hypothetical protein